MFHRLSDTQGLGYQKLAPTLSSWLSDYELATKRYENTHLLVLTKRLRVAEEE